MIKRGSAFNWFHAPFFMSKQKNHLGLSLLYSLICGTVLLCTLKVTFLSGHTFYTFVRPFGIFLPLDRVAINLTQY